MNRNNYSDRSQNSNGYKNTSRVSNGNNSENYSFLFSLKKKHLFMLSIFSSLLLAFFFMGGFALAELIGAKADKEASNKNFTGEVDVVALDKEGKFPSGLQFDHQQENSTFAKENGSNDGVGKESNIIFESSVGNIVNPQSMVTKNDADMKAKLRALGKVVKNSSLARENFTTAANKNDVQITAVKKKTVSSENDYEKKPQPGVDYYFLQVVVTTDIEKAKIIAQKLLIENFYAVVHKKEMSNIKNLAADPSAPINNQPVYVVRVGLYKNKKTALYHLSLLQDYAGFKDAFIRAYRS